MSQVERRLEELRNASGTELDQVERGAVHFLHVMGVENLADVIHFAGKDKYTVWAAETIVWTCGRLRAQEYREAVRGFGQLSLYKGQNGGFLPVGISDALAFIQNALEARFPR